MKTNHIQFRSRTNKQGGFSLLEFLVAMSIFLLVTGVALSLFTQQQTSSNTMQGQVGLNLALRNAVSQVQMDVTNAGSGYFQGVNVPSWPVGVTIINNVVGAGLSCYNPVTLTYGSTCFDQLNVITTADPTVYPPINASDSTGAQGLGNCSTTNSGTAYGSPATGLTAAQTAAKFLRGDQLLFLNSSGNKLTSVVLTANAAASGNSVQFTFNATRADGSNTLANDPLDITACHNTTPCPASGSGTGKFYNQFCGGDFILKLAPITYQVCAGPGSPSPCDTSNSSPDIADPKLVRIQNGSMSTIMDQVIGMKIGASIWQQQVNNSTDKYIYDASTYWNTNANDKAFDFTVVRSVRISLIGRTTPSTDQNNKFRNNFDQGRYQVQGIAIVVNPRNMSMND